MGITVKMGERFLEMNGPYMTELRESNDIADDAAALRERMREDGYLFIRGFHDREQVFDARRAFVRRVAEQGKLKPGTEENDAVIGEANKGASFLGTHDQPRAFLDLVNGERVMSFFDRFLDEPSMTYDYKWARAMGTGDFSGAHYDIVYMGRGTDNLYTVWTPLGDVSHEMGGLAILLGSHRLEQVKATYGRMDVDRDKVRGWFSNDPLEVIEKFGGRWATAEFRAGDAIVFGMYTMHGSLTNQTDRYRLSCDTRYQRKSDPVDERWIGKKPKGHYAWNDGAGVTMEEARAQWGV